MNLKSQDPTDLVVGLLDRSICAIQVAACLVDKWGVFAWGWNHAGNGFGKHAEAFCLTRANPRRLSQATLYIASRRARNGKIVTSRPCLECQPLIRKVGRVIYRDASGEWVEFKEGG